MNNTIRINLLDWRSARRERRRRDFLRALALTALTCCAVLAFVTSHYQGNRIDVQQQRNAYLQQQLDIVVDKLAELKEIKAQRTVLLRQIHAIEELQQARLRMGHYFAQIANSLPDGVFLTTLKRNGDITTLQGLSDSSARVSDYMANLDTTTQLQDAELVVMKADPNSDQQSVAFTVRVTNIRAKQQLHLAEAVQ